MELGEIAGDARPDPHEREFLAEVLRSIRALTHGSVQVIVKDARVVQIDTRDQKRFERFDRRKRC